MMAKRSDIEKQIAALQAELEGADTDDEIWIKDGDHEVKVSGKRATTVLARYSKLWETNDDAAKESEEEPPADSEGDEDDADDTPPDDKPAQRGYFGRKG